MFWKLYRNTPKKRRKAFIRESFWAWMFDHCPRIYKLLDKVLPWDTLPF